MPIPIKKLSYTYLHTLACSYASFLKYEGHLKGPVTPPLTLGNAVHFALEQAHLQPTLSLQFAVTSFLDEHRRIVKDDDVFISYPEIKKNESEGSEMIQKYFFMVGDGRIQEKPLAVERAFKLAIGGTQIVGKIDKVERRPEGLVVIDYKTGRKEPDTWFLKRNLQFTAYWWAIKEEFGEYPVKAVWHHLRNGKMIETTRSEWDIEQLKRSVESALKMNADDTRFRIYHEKVCDWCPFKGPICDDPELEEQIVSARGNTKN